MSCKYCELKLKDRDQAKCGELIPSSLSYLDESPYIRYDNDEKFFEILVPYDCGYAATSVENIKFCPMCGTKLCREEA